MIDDNIEINNNRPGRFENGFNGILTSFRDLPVPPL
jgi:hypothetical protein